MKRVQLNLALAVAAAGLGAAVLLGQKKETAKTEPLTALKPDAIEHVVIAHPGKPEIHLDRQNGHWMLTAPIAVETDRLNVNSVLALAVTEIKTKLNPAEVQKSALGLDPPAYSVKLNDTLLQFGGVESLRYQRYIGVGDKIVLIDDLPASSFDADYSDLVSKSPLPSNAEIQKIEVPGLTVERSSDGKNWTATPASNASDFGELQQFVDGWKNERAMWCQLDNGVIDASAETVTITLKDRKLNFRIISREPQFVIAAPDLKLRYTLSKTEVEKLLKLPTAKPEAPKSAASVGQTESLVLPKTLTGTPAGLPPPASK